MNELSARLTARNGRAGGLARAERAGYGGSAPVKPSRASVSDRSLLVQPAGSEVSRLGVFRDRGRAGPPRIEGELGGERDQHHEEVNNEKRRGKGKVRPRDDREDNQNCPRAEEPRSYLPPVHDLQRPFARDRLSPRTSLGFPCPESPGAVVRIATVSNR